MFKRGRRAMALLGVGPLFFMQCAPEGCAPSTWQPRSGEDYLVYRNGGTQVESWLHLAIVNANTGSEIGKRRFDAKVDLGYTTFQTRGRMTTVIRGGTWTLAEHYLVGEPGRTFFLGTASSYPQRFKYWEPYEPRRVLDGLATSGHIATGCAVEPEDECATAGRAWDRIYCSPRAEQCYFNRLPDVEPNADDATAHDSAAYTWAVQAEPTRVWLDGGPPEMSAEEQAENDALIAQHNAEQRDYATDAWFLGDIDLVLRGDSGIGADAWTEDKRLDHARLAEYGYRYDPEEWFVPL